MRRILDTLPYWTSGIVLITNGLPWTRSAQLDILPAVDVWGWVAVLVGTLALVVACCKVHARVRVVSGLLIIFYMGMRLVAIDMHSPQPVSLAFWSSQLWPLVLVASAFGSPSISAIHTRVRSDVVGQSNAR